MNAGPSTALVSDTTPYLPEEEIRRNDIREVSLYVSLEGEQRPESEITDYAEFYARLLDSDEGATTSQPSVGDFVSVYEPLLAGGQDVVSMHISSGISGTVEAALQARQRLVDEGKGGESIHVYDCRSCAGGMALQVLAAASVARSGGGAEAMVERAQAARDELGMWFAVDTLEYLRRGGRIGAASALLGSTLKIKPILMLEEEITPVARVRTRKRALERMVEYGRELHDRGADAWVVQHVQEPDTAQEFVGQCREVFGCEPVFVTEIGPVLGAHVGPMIGIGGVSPKLLE